VRYYNLACYILRYLNHNWNETHTDKRLGLYALHNFDRATTKLRVSLSNIGL
jgi:hypothetical protein